VADDALWLATSSLPHYVPGVAGRNAVNAQFARAEQPVRPDFLGAVAAQWAALDNTSKNTN
jgi:hypothetical protein